MAHLRSYTIQILFKTMTANFSEKGIEPKTKKSVNLPADTDPDKTVPKWLSPLRTLAPNYKIELDFVIH